ncbi:MAG: copper-binding protein [Beijerinckiaceae bacterium]
MIRTSLLAVAASVVLMSTAMAQSASGTVKKVDVSAGKMTIIHGPIKNLNMEAMTMVFRVSDPSMLKQIKAGNKILFDADRINGALTVTKIKKR